MRRRAFIATAGVAPLAGCLDVITGNRLSCDEDCDIGMSSNAFDPVEFHTIVGETVTWVNTSSRAHTVTALEAHIPDNATYFASGGYDSQQDAVDAWHDGPFGGRLNSGESYRHTFEIPGTYEYYCIPHVAAGMFGTVVVTED